ncbi:hypothetical protein AJ78_07604 [Emergomyces pasteurianus Ep9510]|uniref:Uncharacterized protein n=1 Tax=Emergomyces pasteurianus Ep9510 TaxID=1447872 RepID=A0A1J9Q6X2_9EURO|nr:hypothetical protein AJ78_07604 [Emergomyces pasteurianus Ep9510]
MTVLNPRGEGEHLSTVLGRSGDSSTKRARPSARKNLHPLKESRRASAFPTKHLSVTDPRIPTFPSPHEPHNHVHLPSGETQKRHHSLLPRPGPICSISLEGSRCGRRENHGRIGYESPKENENERHTTAVHTCSYSLAYAASSQFRPCAFILYHNILASLHGVRGADMLRNAQCDFSSLAYISQGFHAGVDGSHRKIATLELELKLGSFEPRAAEKGGWKTQPFPVISPSDT